MPYTTQQLIESVKQWLTRGHLIPDTLSNKFTFISPFWKEADSKSFIDKFLNPTEYIEKSLKNIIKFDPIIICVSEDDRYFTLTLTYHTKNKCSVDEVVVCEVENGLLSHMKTIYDLEQTKRTHHL